MSRGGPESEPKVRRPGRRVTDHKVKKMNLLHMLPVKIKLPLSIVGLCLATGVVMQIANDLESRAETRSMLQETFESTAQARQAAVVSYLQDASIDLQILASSPDVSNALGALSSSFKLMENPLAELQQAYLTANPNPPGQRQALDKAEGDAPYHIQHKQFHPVLRSIQERQGLYDIFLFDKDLNAVYTVFKEVDFAASFAEGPLAQTGLGKALRKAEQAEPGTVIYADFQPYAPSNESYAAFLVTRIANRAGITQGYVAFQINSHAIGTILKDPHGLGETGRSYLIGGLADGQPYALAMGQTSDAGDIMPLRLEGAPPQLATAGPDESVFLDAVPLANGQPGFALTRTVTFGDTTWGFVVERETADVYAHATQAMLKAAGMGLLICLGGAILGVLFARSISNPLDRVTSAIEQIARDNLDVRVADTDRADEIGIIANAVGGLVDKLAAARLAEEERARLQEDLRLVVEAISAGLQDLSKGDLTRPISREFTDDYDSLRQDFNATLETLAQTITRVIEASQSIRSRSDAISTASDDLSRRTENQAAALEQTAAALDQMTASVRSAAEGAREVEGIVGAARKQAEDSGSVVQAAVAAMAEIEKSSQQISQIISAIDDIAFQTNLLALNAGVEAARAGDAGKGFAVVASEVRALAQRSSSAAKEIKALIAASAQHVGRGVEEVGKAGQALHSIVGSVTNISNLVSNIATGAAEQSTGLAEINIGVTQLDQVTQQNAAMVGESTAASQALHQDATMLFDLVSGFRIPVPEGQPDRVISISQFVPTDFAGAASFADDRPGPAEAPPPPPARVAATSGTAALWQDF